MDANNNVTIGSSPVHLDTQTDEVESIPLRQEFTRGVIMAEFTLPKNSKERKADTSVPINRQRISGNFKLIATIHPMIPTQASIPMKSIWINADQWFWMG